MLCLTYSQGFLQRKHREKSYSSTLKQKKSCFWYFKSRPGNVYLCIIDSLYCKKKSAPPFSPTLLPNWYPGVFLVLPLGEGWRHTSLEGQEKPATNSRLAAGWPCRVEPTSVQILSFLNQHVATLWMGSLTGLFLLGGFTVRGILNQSWRYPGYVQSRQL